MWNNWGAAFMIKPGKYQEYVESFTDDLVKVKGAEAVSLGLLATDLYTDFDSNNWVGKEDAVRLAREAVEIARAKGLKVGATGANSYLAGMLDYVYRLPMSSNNNPVIDRSVPFLQIALSGSVYYTGTPVNESFDFDFAVLKCIETGSAVYFDCIWEDNTITKESAFDYLYAVNYENNKARMLEAKEKVGTALRGMYGRSIVGHEHLGGSVYRTVYDNGKWVIVNYGPEAVETAFGVVEAQGFLNN